MTFDPGAPHQRRFAHYGPAPIPAARDTEMDEFIDAVWRGGETAVYTALAAVAEPGRRVLCTYAERLAARAVRNETPEDLMRALIALVIGGLDQNTPETLMCMALVEDAARRLNYDLAELFEETSGVVGHPGTVHLVQWLSRRPEDRTLTCMGFEARNDGSGFRYYWVA